MTRVSLFALLALALLGSPKRFLALATDLVQANADLIRTGGTPATLAIKQATLTIPIVFNLADDPVAGGWLPTYGRRAGSWGVRR